MKNNEKYRWVKDYFSYNDYKPFNVKESYDEAVNDFDGKGHMSEYDKQTDKDLFPAYKFCTEYKNSTIGINKGDCYLPSSGEMLQTIRNQYIINKSLNKIGSAELTDVLYWCLTEKNQIHAWHCSVIGTYIDYNNVKWDNHIVRSFILIENTTKE